MKRFLPLVIGIIVSLLSSTIIQYSAAETAPSFTRQWGGYGLQTTGLFAYPWDLVADSAGNIYVTDSGNRRIQKFDNNGNYLHSWGAKGSGNGQFQNPNGIAIDGDYIYVVDNDLGRVQKFDTSGTYITQWGTKGQEVGKFMVPQGITVDSKGNVYVADTGNSRIQKFTSDGKLLLSWGESGLGIGQFLYPRAIAADSQGSIYVSDSGNNRLQKFTSDGVYVRTFDVSSGSSLKYPQGIKVDSSGNIYIVDSGNNRVVKIDRNGNSLSSWGSQGKAIGNFDSPKGVALDSNGNVFVADTNNNRIEEFSYPPPTETKITTQTTTNQTQNIKPNPNDKTAPVLTAPADMTVEATGKLTSVLIGQATATDASGIASITNDAPDKFPLGITIVTWTATDGAGNVAKATQRITLVDTTAPVLSAPPGVIVEAQSPTDNVVDLGTPASSDAIGVISVTNDAPKVFPLGDTIVTWTAKDAAGNTATAKQVVTVQDTKPPKIRAPPDVVVEATSAAHNIVALGDPTVTDNGIIQSITN
ncbi:MAG: SMP-30/gluconolactonase/LRE family protein, partial [Thaumarchaeota archaeon]|nr:SMP-30/gluconolactonase/LRE family protein [Nitrososphaerota archaeon]